MDNGLFEHNDEWYNTIKIMERYKIDFNGHIKSGWLIVLCVIICVNFPRILSFLYPNQRYEDSVLVGMIVFIVFGLPAFIIHVNYYLVNKGDILKYSDKKKKL